MAVLANFVTNNALKIVVKPQPQNIKDGVFNCQANVSIPHTINSNDSLQKCDFLILSYDSGRSRRNTWSEYGRPPAAGFQGA